jgi:hypothetical protein
MVIKRTFYPHSKNALIYLGFSSITQKTIEYNSNPGTITGTACQGGNGSFTSQWQRKISGSTLFEDLLGAKQQDYVPENMKTTTVFRRKDISAVCGTELYTNEVTINVLANVDAGKIGSSQTICYGSNVLTDNIENGSGGTGTYQYQWQQSGDGNLFQDIPGETGLIYQANSLTTTTYFKRKCTSGTNTAESNIVKIMVREELTSGTVSESQTICYNTKPTPLIGTIPKGGDGNYYIQWESSSNGAIWNKINGASDMDYSPDELSTSIKFRRIVTSGSNCGFKTSEPVTITVMSELNAGSISASQVICAGTTPSGITGSVASGGDGTYTYQWKYSEDGTQWNDINNTNSPNYRPELLTKSTYFKRDILNICGLRSSDALKIEVKPELKAGSIASSQNVCFNAVPKMFTGNDASGGFGIFTYQWQNSTDNQKWNDIIGANELNYQPINQVLTLYFRRKTNESKCGEVYSNNLLISTASKIPKPEINVKPFYCEAENVTLQAPTSNLTFLWCDEQSNVIFTGPTFTQKSISQNESLYLKARDDKGCLSDTQKITLLVDKVKASFLTAAQTVKAGDPIQFSNQSENAATYNWNFSEGEPSTVKEPWHIFNKSGKKTITLIVKSAKSCSDTLVRPDYILVSALGMTSTIEKTHRVYPNPVSKNLWVDFDDKTAEFKVTLWDINGKKLFEKTAHGFISIDFAYPSGMYLLGIYQGKNQEVYKIVK